MTDAELLALASDAPPLTGSQAGWALAAIVLFLIWVAVWATMED